MTTQSFDFAAELPSTSSSDGSTIPVSGPTPATSTPIPEILDIEQAAAALRCSVDTIRRLDYDELPRYNGPGRKLLFLERDIISYVRRHRVRPEQAGREASAKVAALARAVRDGQRGRSNVRMDRSKQKAVAQGAARC